MEVFDAEMGYFEEVGLVEADDAAAPSGRLDPLGGPTLADARSGRVPNSVPDPVDFQDADWFLDLCPPYCFLIHRAALAAYLEQAAIIEQSETVRELAVRLLDNDDEAFMEVFGVDSVEELEADCDNIVGGPLDMPWDPSLISSYHTVPDTRVLFGSGSVPDVVEDLLIDDEGLVDGWEYSYIPYEQHETVLERLRSANVDYREAPGLIDDLLGLAHGGNLA